MKQIFSILFILIPLLSFGQDYQLPNENVIIEFFTLKGKKLVVAIDSNNQYLIYRYGTADNIELTFPEDLTNSWALFQHSFYLRGEGIQNEGMDLDYLYFDIENFRYVVYQEYHASTTKVEHGIKVINQDTKEETVIKAKEKTVNGSISKLRDSEKIRKGDELF